MFENHECEMMPKGTVAVFTMSALTEDSRDSQWLLRLIRSATAQDLEENHSFEEVGDLVCSATVAIKNCPYCGVELQKTLELGENNECYFEVLDFSEYNSRVL